MEFNEIISLLEKNSSKKNAAGMARFGITGTNAYGVGMPFVRNLAKRIKKEAKGGSARNSLAEKLWAHGFHEDKIVAALVAEPSIGWKQAEKWVSDCSNWAETDQLAMNLLWRMEGAPEKALEFSKSEEEFVKRAGFALMAVIPWRQKKGFPDAVADKFLAAIARESSDDRNFVKKAVNWALRHIGKMGSKRNYGKALALSRKLAKSEKKAARWIGSDAARELEARRPGA
ncbi:MAG: DNA alkylation repair protein [Candidatus ainarchaeum sp.]|nr:DNA alkylation repair protein [Candidatus ainarchaeum sp.]